MAENEVLHNGVCRVILDAARDFIENIDKNDNAGKVKEKYAKMIVDLV